jgi:signal recognition particle receptor subunit beta
MDQWVRQAQAWAGQAESWVRQHPPEQIYVAAAVVALTILFLIAGADSNLASSCSAFCTVPGF